jgi:large subunit ribosomal protein L15
MQLHQIKAKTKKKNKKRIGRGGKRGTYSGKGIKGQKSRAGRKMRPQWRDIIKKLPKRRGYRFASIKKKPAVLNLDVLEKKFNENEKVTPKILFEKGIIKKTKGILPEVKLLGGGEITKPLLVSECQISKHAKDKIEKAGGKYVE